MMFKPGDKLKLKPDFELVFKKFRLPKGDRKKYRKMLGCEILVREVFYVGNIRCVHVLVDDKHDYRVAYRFTGEFSDEFFDIKLGVTTIKLYDEN